MPAKKTLLQSAALGAALFAACLLWGCKDNPQDKADRAVRRDTGRALADIGGINSGRVSSEELQGRIESAIRKNQTGGLTLDTALFSAASLKLLNLRRDCADIRLDWNQTGQMLNRLCSQIRRMGQTKMQSVRIETLLQANQFEIDHIALLVGDTQRPQSLTGKLAVAQSQQQQLRLEKAGIEEKESQYRQKLAELQTAAEEKFRLSEQKQGQQQQVLQKEGFDLLAGKKTLYLSMQETVNNLEAVNGRLAIAEAAAARLEADLARAQKSIEKMKDSTSIGLLISQKESLAAEYDRQKQAAIQSISAINTQVEQYGVKAMEILAAADELAGEYEKIRSRDLEPTVSLLLGEVYIQAGLVAGGLAEAKMDVGERLAGILKSEAGIEDVNDIKMPDSKPDNSLVARAMEYLDKSDSSCQKAFSTTGRGDIKETQCIALKGQILAANSKIRLADRLEDYEIADAAQGRLDTLFAKGREYGALFLRSETAAMVQQGLSYTPMLPVDMSMTLEAIKNEFGRWRELAGSLQEEAVNKLLTRTDALSVEYAKQPEIIQFLRQERTALEEAKKRGFAEAMSVSDANSI